MINLENKDFKSTEELKEIAPSIFTKNGAKSTSSKYTHIPTDRVIKDMELLGWGVFGAQEVKSRKVENLGFQKHLVIFRNPDVVIKGKDGDDVYPQILLTNSHDGKNSFSFTAGLYRMVCANGLVIPSETFESLKIRHMGYDFEALQDVMNQVINNLNLTVESMNKMKNTRLKEEETLKLAEDLLSLRVEDGAKITKDSIEGVLNIQRNEDEGEGLWEVFNRIQENIIEGNFSYVSVKGKTRNARVIKNFKQDMELNSKMFTKALEYVI